MPTLHTLEPDARTLHGTFSRDRAPVLTVDPGDTVRFRTLDGNWGLEPYTPGSAQPRREFPHTAGHALVGPVAVRGAQAGMTLAVDIGAIVPGAYGATLPGGYPSAVNDRLGISVEPVSPDAAQELQLPADTRGLIVTNVTPGGPAWQVLFDDPQQGGPDIILSVEGKAVRTETDLRKALQAEKPGSIVTLRIYNPRAQNRRVERIKLGEGQ